VHIRLYEFISHGKGNPKASVDPQSQARRNHPGLLPTGHKALRGFMAPAANQLFGPPRHANKALRPATCLCPFCLRKVGDLLSLQRIMGHTDLAMTKRYVAYTLGDIKEQHAHASPVNKLVSARKRVRRVKSTT